MMSFLLILTDWLENAVPASQIVVAVSQVVLGVIGVYTLCLLRAYTQATTSLRELTQSQYDRSLMPILTLTLAPTGSPELSNVGSGPALDIHVQSPSVRVSAQNYPRNLAPGEHQSIALRRDGSAFPEWTQTHSERLRNEIRQDLEDQPHDVVLEITYASADKGRKYRSAVALTQRLQDGSTVINWTNFERI